MSASTIIEHLQASKATGKAFLTELTATVKAAGLKVPGTLGDDAKLAMTRLSAMVPAVNWLQVGETSGEVQSADAVGRFSTKVSCHYDRTHLVVAEHHIRGQEGDYDYSAWAAAKRFPSAAKAEAQWAKLAKKYRFESGVAAAPAAPAAKTAPKAGVNELALLERWWEAPDDDDTLRVLADLWAERGELRGEFIQLSLLKSRTAAQEARLASLTKKGGALIGPARPFLREWEFGANGLVQTARCEADKLAEGIAEISKVNPRLTLCVTSLKKQSTITALSKVSLEPVHFVAFTMGIIGSLGGSNLTDKALVGVAPAFRGVKNLALQARGYEGECFTPQGLRSFADQLQGLEFFALDFYTSDRDGKAPLPPLSQYVEVVTSHHAFKSLKAVIINGASAAQLKKALPTVVTVVTAEGFDRYPSNAQALAALTQG